MNMLKQLKKIKHMLDLILLETLEYNGTKYYKKYTSFNHNNWDNIPIDNIIFKYYVNRIHYQL